MKNKNKEILWNIFFLVMVAVISVSLTKISYELYQNTKIYKIEEIPAEVKIERVVGIAVDGDRLNFGIIRPGSSMTRQIRVEHNYEEPLLVKITYKGTIKKVLGAIDPIILEQNTEKNISITAHGIPEYGNYTGTVKVIFMKQ